MTIHFKADIYRDQDTGRQRWAVLDLRSRTWYFPKSYGARAAWRLAKRMQKEAQ